MEKEKGVKLILADNMKASAFEGIRDQLVDALTASDRIELDLGNNWNLDSSIVDLLCSAHRVADSLGKSFTFSSAATIDKIQELAIDSGFADIPCKYRGAGCLYHDQNAEVVVKIKK